MKAPQQIRKSRFVFLTLPQYSAIALTNAVEPLRMANQLAGQPAYEWVIASLDGRPMSASNGLSVAPTVPLDQSGRADIVFVCGGVNVRDAVSPALLAALRLRNHVRVEQDHSKLTARAADLMRTLSNKACSSSVRPPASRAIAAK